jgi:predicted DNA-binding transcriptional regulator YafY
MGRGNQLIRQWQLLKTLQNHRYGISIDELMERAHCTRRTVERDLAVLKEVNFPISAEVKDFGKKLWKLEPNFLNSQDLIIGITEIVSLHLAQQLLSPLAGTHLGDGLEQFWKKIEMLLPKKAIEHFMDLDETLYVKAPVKENFASQGKVLQIIDKGTTEGKVLKINYCKSPGEKPSQILYHPYGMVLFGASLYVIGYSATAQAIRTLKVQRMAGAEVTDMSFVRPKDFSLEHCVSHSFGIITLGEKPVTIRCRFHDWAAQMVREQKWHGSQIIEKDNGKGLVASFLLENTVEFKRWMLGFGATASVIEPQTFREEMTQTLQATLKNYKKL